MTKKKILLLVFALVFLISLVNAQQQTLGTFKQYECIELKQTCANCSYVNITRVSYPNSEIAISGQFQMTKSDTIYNLTYCETNLTGSYIVDWKADPNGATTSGNYNFFITPTGRGFDSGQSLAAIAILGASLILSFLFMLLGFKLGNEPKLLPVAFFFVMIAIGLGIYALHLSYAFSNDIVNYESLTPLTSAVYVSILWMITGLAVMFTAIMLIAFIRELSNVVTTRKFGDDFNPLTGTYE